MVQMQHQDQNGRRFSRLCKPKFISIFAVASLLLLALLSIFLFLSLAHSTHPHHLSTAAVTPPQVEQACKATRDPATCEATLAQSSPTLRSNPTPLQIIQHSILSTFQNLQTAQSMTKSILDSPSAANPNVTDAARNCLESLFYSEYRLNSTAVALPRGRLKDARAWTSAALSYETGCWSGLSNLIKNQQVNDSQRVNETIAYMNSTVIALTSNTLSMMVSYDLFGEKLDLWRPPRTERDGFWEESSGADLGFKGGFPAGLTADVTVCKEEGKGCVETVQEAVNKTPDGLEGRRFVIKIDEGVYEEIVRVPLEKSNVVFLGDGVGKTVITGSLTVGQPGMNTYNSATVGVVGDGFMARDITFQNTAGPETFQAVAFRSSSDLSIIENCEFLGHQDTLYAHSLRQFYKSCRIEGNIDFIFGNAAAIFQDSVILIRPRQQEPEHGETNPVTAHGRTDPAQSTGLVFQNCVINGTEEYVRLYHSNPKVHKNYLGRPWKEFCRTVFIHCTLGDLISSDGWMIWSGDFALSTVYYGEFENSGPGANVTHRVPWSNQIPKEHVLAYSIESFIQGNEWIATTA